MYTRFVLATLAILVPTASARAALVLDAPDGIRQGYLATFRITGARPGAKVVLLKGDPGPGACPPQLGGLCLGITDHVVLGTRTADANGVAVFTPTVPISVPWGPLSLQAAQGGATPAVSNIDTTAVLYDASGVSLTVFDAATLDAARYAWRVRQLWFQAGAYPDTVYLPYLLEACYLQISNQGRSVTAANAVTIGNGRINNVDAPSLLTLPAATGSGTCIDVAIELDATLADASIELPQWEPGIPLYLAVVGNYAPTRVSMPLVTRLSRAVVLNNDAPVDLELDSAESVEQDLLFWYSPFSEIRLPALTTVGQLHVAYTDLSALALPNLVGTSGSPQGLRGDLNISGNSSLTRIVMPSLATVGGGGDLAIAGNLVLNDISEMGIPQVDAFATVIDNPLLPSCAAAALSPGECHGNQLDSCSDDYGDVCYPGA